MKFITFAILIFITLNPTPMKKRTLIVIRLFIISVLFITLATSCKKDNDDTETVTDIDGNVYNTVTIGTQVWLKENLKTTKYRNGDEIGTTTPATKNISGETSPKYQWAYNGNESNVATYGRLYTWYVVNDSRGICPTGWHVPADSEWKAMVDFLGGVIEADAKLKENSSLWEGSNEANNKSGFTARPGGWRCDCGDFDYLGEIGWWWSSTEESPYFAYDCSMTSGYGPVQFNASGRKTGLELRCIKD